MKQVTFFFAALFQPQSEKTHSYLSLIAQVILYLGGAVLWGYFWGWGQVSLNYHDWANINIPRLDVIKDALTYGQLPLYVADTVFLHGTHRFFALPDVITTPQMILLRFISLENFVFIDLLIHYTISFFCLSWLSRHFKLSLAVFALLVGLFNFNGYILTHYAVGHFTWAGYFLFPAFFIFMIEFVEKKPNWFWVTKVSLLLLYMVLAGSEHHFVWVLVFLAVLSFVEYKKFFWGLAAMAFSGLASAVRLIPPAFSVAQLQETTKGILYAYDGPVRIFQMLISYQPPKDAIVFIPKVFAFISDNQSSGKNLIYTVDLLYWEYALYVGILAAIILVIFGVVGWFHPSANATLKKFGVPSLFVLCLTISGNFDLLRVTGFPLFLGERVSARMIGLPLAFLILFALVNFQGWLNRSDLKPYQYLALLAGIAIIFTNLFRHLSAWQLAITGPAFGTLYLDRPEQPMPNLAGNSLTSMNDPTYIFSLWLGLIITILAIGFLLWISKRTQRKND